MGEDVLFSEKTFISIAIAFMLEKSNCRFLTHYFTKLLTTIGNLFVEIRGLSQNSLKQKHF